MFNSSVLSTLDLSYCGCVKQIHANALAPLRHLKNLNLENSPFGLHNSLKALYGLRGANMTSLNLRHVDVDMEIITKRLPDEQLFAEHLRYLKTICVSEFNMAENHIIYIHLESLFNQNNNFARCLKRLDFHENALYGNYGEFILIPIIMKNIEYIDISRFSSYCGTTTKTTLKSLFWDIKFNILPRKLETLIIDAASKDIMASYFDTVSLEGQLTGLNNLKTLKLSHNNKMELSASFFDTFPSLENLHLNDVSLPENYFCQNGLRLFSNLTNLKHLDLSGNGIRCLPMGIFENNHRLQTLILSNNKFRTIPFSIHDSPSLLTLVVARNEIEFLDESTTTALDTHVVNRTFHLDLSENPFICVCNENLHFIFWIQTNSYTYNRREYHCTSENGRTTLVDLNAERLWRHCIGLVWVAHSRPLAYIYDFSIRVLVSCNKTQNASHILVQKPHSQMCYMSQQSRF